MGQPTFSQIVSMGEVTLPVAGLLINFDYALGHDGIVGIKTGTPVASCQYLREPLIRCLN
jgi:hypothetical protein